MYDSIPESDQSYTAVFVDRMQLVQRCVDSSSWFAKYYRAQGLCRVMLQLHKRMKMSPENFNNGVNTWLPSDQYVVGDVADMENIVIKTIPDS